MCGGGYELRSARDSRVSTRPRDAQWCVVGDWHGRIVNQGQSSAADGRGTFHTEGGPVPDLRLGQQSVGKRKAAADRGEREHVGRANERMLQERQLSRYVGPRREEHVQREGRVRHSLAVHKYDKVHLLRVGQREPWDVEVTHNLRGASQNGSPNGKQEWNLPTVLCCTTNGGASVWKGRGVRVRAVPASSPTAGSYRQEPGRELAYSTQ